MESHRRLVEVKKWQSRIETGDIANKVRSVEEVLVFMVAHKKTKTLACIKAFQSFSLFSKGIYSFSKS